MSSRLASTSSSRSRSNAKKSNSYVHVIVFAATTVVLGVGGGLAYVAMNKPIEVAKASKPKPSAKPDADLTPDKDAAAAEADEAAAKAKKKKKDAAGKKSGRPYGRARTPGPFAEGNLAQSRADAEYYTNELATDRVGWEIVDGLEARPTLAIWLFDRTPAAAQARANVVDRFHAVYEGFDKLKKDGNKAFEEGKDGPPLLTAIAAFGKTCEFLNPEPTDDPAVLNRCLGSINDEEGAANTFAAIKKVINEYASYRTTKHRSIVLTVVSDQRGADDSKVDELVPLLEKYAISLYVIGVPSPLGRDGALTSQAAPGSKHPPQVGPESLAKEMVAIDFDGVSFSKEMFDSGFGPFALSRLCKVSGGSYLMVRASSNNKRGNFSNIGVERFDAKVMAKYAPDYVSQAEYDSLLSENKCRAALHKVAMEEPIELGNTSGLITTFVKQDEATLKRECDKAQQSVARIEPKLRPLYATLSAAESDRPKLTGARWQAEYDLAMGRVLGARARYEGYNTAIAQIKQGKRPGKPTDSIWTMVPSASFSSDSTIDKLVKQSRKYLEQVVKDHPETPWAFMAQRELNGTMCGWEWIAQ